METTALLPYQQAWVADKTQVKLYTKSRRIGISWAEAAAAALTAARANGSNVTYICYDKDVTRQFVKDCAAWAKVYDLAASEIEESVEVFRDGDEDKSVLIFRIYFASGFEVEAVAGTPRKLRGRKGCVVVDEAAFLDDLDAVVEAALALLVWGGSLHLITTYNGVDNAYYRLEQDVLAGKLPYSLHRTTFREAVSQGLYRRICLVTNRPWSPEAEEQWVAETYSFFGDRAAQELDCVPAQSGGKYLPLVLIERAMTPAAPVLTYQCPEGWAAQPQSVRENHAQDWLEAEVLPVLESRADPNLKTVCGLDFGRSGDLSVLNLAQVWENLTRATVLGLELRNVPFEQQRQILWAVLRRSPKFVAGALDCRGNGQHLGEVTAQQFGYGRIHQVMLSRSWYAEWFPRYKAALEDGRILLPASANWRDDHRLVEVDKGVPVLPDRKNQGSDGKQRHGDSVIACLLMWSASCGGEPAPVEFRTLGRPSSALGAYSEPAARSRFAPRRIATTLPRREIPYQ